MSIGHISKNVFWDFLTPFDIFCNLKKRFLRWVKITQKTENSNVFWDISKNVYKRFTTFFEISAVDLCSRSRCQIRERDRQTRNNGNETSSKVVHRAVRFLINVPYPVVYSNFKYQFWSTFLRFFFKYQYNVLKKTPFNSKHVIF